jgi:hypothetical protein
MTEIDLKVNSVSPANAFSLYTELKLHLDSIRIGTRETPLGLEVCLVCCKGYSFKDCFEEIDQRSKGLYDRPVFSQASPLLKADPGFESVVTKDAYFGIIPIVSGTAGRYTHGDLSKIVTDPYSRIEELLSDSTMQDVLHKNNLDWVPRGVLAAAAGGYRVSKGFPEAKRVGLGNIDDHGDLLRGNAVFCSPGYLAIGSHKDGIVGFPHGFAPAREKALFGERFQTVAAGLSFAFTE